MGEVYRARQLTLRRDVAIKILPAELATDPARLARFEREARTASSLNHPNIVVIHDIATHEGTTYIAMELVEGRTLRDLIAGERLPIARVLRLATQIADGLARAHAAGIIHRDIKPANIMVTGDDRVKILDFGLAKPLVAAGGATTIESVAGAVVGTPLYMSPEQVSADSVDHRSDQFSLGIVLYEMVAGKPPFEGPSLIRAILTADPPPLRRARTDAPAELERIIRKCLEKDPEKRYYSTNDLAAELRRLEESTRAGHGVFRTLRRPAVATTLGAVVLALGATGVLWARGSSERWARDKAPIEIANLTETGHLYEAFRTARRAQAYLPDDPGLEKLVNRITLPTRINTVPPGAEVFAKGYGTPDAPWERIGVTPLTLRIPYAMMRWRITKPGHEPFEGAPFSGAGFAAFTEGIILDSAGTVPPGMVRVPGGTLGAIPGVRRADAGGVVHVESFFLDRYEVTNRQFKHFVDAGGYAKQEYWPTSTSPDAVASFRDATGQPGPSTWEAGTFPAGEDEFPVGGISWYEAAAYCAFAGKSLPTVYHWFRGIGQHQLSDILLYSNLAGDAKARVGQFQGLAAYGTYDMAGNVREWAWNATDSLRYILGGAWNEPSYMFRHAIAQDPAGREPTNGVRCAKYLQAPPDPLLEPVARVRQYERPAPISDEAFEVLRGIYAYDRTPLEARIVRVNDSIAEYRRETVSIRTAYGQERMEVHLLIPRNVSPPYQSVIWFPGGDASLLRSSENFSSAFLVDFIPRSGRVLVHPVYKGMYERFEPPPSSPATLRDFMVRWSQDLGRTIDYLETRPDFDARKIAYYGLSAGANHGIILTTVDTRFAAAILLGGGLAPIPRRPEMHQVHFAPRARTPTLMINGRDDFMFPYELSQQPLFELLGLPPDKKRHALLDGGHLPPNRLAIIREVLDWLDRHLGPVPTTAQVANAAARR
jgi:predicted esterase